MNERKTDTFEKRELNINIDKCAAAAAVASKVASIFIQFVLLIC